MLLFCLSAYTKNQCRAALSIHCYAFIPGMSCLLTGMTGSSTVVAQKFGMWLITMMVVRLTRTTSSPSWMCVLPLIRSQQYGTEWRLLGGAGLRNHYFVCYEKTATFFLRKMLNYFPQTKCIHNVTMGTFQVCNQTWSFHAKMLCSIKFWATFSIAVARSLNFFFSFDVKRKVIT